MPSTVVHVGIAALLGCALLSDHFDAKAILIVMVAAAFPDLDTFIGLWVMEGAHRTVLHNLVLPTLVLLIIWWDARWRSASWIRQRWGAYGVRVSWVSILAGWVVAQVLVDAFYNGANLFWPLYDQFIDLSGRLYLSNQQGIVQTFITVEIGAEGIQFGEEHVRGGIGDTHYYTGIDPGRGTNPNVERYFPIADSGELFVISMAGYLTTAFRLWEIRRS